MQESISPLDQGAFLFIEIAENIQGGASALRFSCASAEQIDSFYVHLRSYFVSSLVAWLYLAQDVADHDAELDLTPPEGSGFPELPELIKHATRTLRHLEETWPYEASFVRQCVYDTKTAFMLVQPMPIPGSGRTIGLMTPRGYEGLISRFPSPTCYYPSRRGASLHAGSTQIPQ